MKPDPVFQPHMHNDALKSSRDIGNAADGKYKRAEYRIVDGPNGVAELEMRVNDMLDRGWKLIGGLSIERGCAYQAMARVTSDPVEPTVPPPTLTACGVDDK